MKDLEIECSECGKKITIKVDDAEYEHYMGSGSLIESSDAYYEFFDGAGWVLQQMPFCDICKYDHSEYYRED